MNGEVLVPLLAVLAALLLAPRRLFPARWFQTLAVAAFAGLMARYMHWRIFTTVMPADPLSPTGLLVWAVFVIEMLAWIDMAMVLAFMLRRTDRSPEADRHEARLRAADPASLPHVDVFIATYNEPPEVLEKTITGAMALDWPKDRITLWVLDDGRRNWLRRIVQDRGARYMTRPDNAGAKAGNINAAIKRTSAPFFLVLDADFVPQKTFLFRTMGFFDDPGIGIVQVPHNFFNSDPIQSSLNMSHVMPDDQRFFFEAIMPGRDGHDCAFCCGSNGIVRRSALEAVGGGLPTDSITEDMLLSIEMLRKGFITRYLNERLAFGLAPESINAFFVQRSRWARGAIQILFLGKGPLGRGGLTWYQRLFFLPTHWFTQSMTQAMAMVIPTFYLWTGVVPMMNVRMSDILSYQIPTIIASVAIIRLFAPGAYHPFAQLAHGVLTAFRILPIVLATLAKPYGHAFKVTPKGGDGTAVVDTTTVRISLGIAAATGLGLVINAFPATQIVPFGHLIPVVTLWALLNMLILLLVAKIATTPPMRRSEERFAIDEPALLRSERYTAEVMLRDISLGGLMAETDGPVALEPGNWVGLHLSGVGLVPGQVRRVWQGGQRVGVVFKLLDGSGSAGHRRRRLRRDNERVATTGDVTLSWDDWHLTARLRDISPTGAGLSVPVGAWNAQRGDWVLFAAPDGETIPAQVSRNESDPDDPTRRVVGLAFHVLGDGLRDRLIEKLFTEGLSQNRVSTDDGWGIFWAMLSQIWKPDMAEAVQPRKAAPETPILPEWLQAAMLEDAAGLESPARRGAA